MSANDFLRSSPFSPFSCCNVYVVSPFCMFSFFLPPSTFSTHYQVEVPASSVAIYKSCSRTPQEASAALNMLTPGFPLTKQVQYFTINNSSTTWSIQSSSSHASPGLLHLHLYLDLQHWSQAVDSLKGMWRSRRHHCQIWNWKGAVRMLQLNPW